MDFWYNDPDIILFKGEQHLSSNPVTEYNIDRILQRNDYPLDSKICACLREQQTWLDILWTGGKVGASFTRTRARLFSLKSACISLPLRSFSLHLKAIPVGHVFLCQGWGQGNKIVERQLCECGGRRKRWTESLKRRVHLFFTFRWLLQTFPTLVTQLVTIDR